MRISDWSSDVCSSDLPLQPALRDLPKPASGPALALAFITGDAGLCEIGHDGAGFAFDCETPRHSVFLAPHALANRLVTNGEYREFIAEGGYRNPLLWVSEGWSTVQQHGWQRPRSEEHTSELQSLMRSSYDGSCLKTKTINEPTEEQQTVK